MNDPYSKQKQTDTLLKKKIPPTPTETKKNDTDEKSNGYHHESPLTFNVNISTKYIKQTQTIYLAQCPSLKHENSKQLALWELLSIQRKNNNYPLMLYLIDTFLRDRLQYFITKNKVLTIHDWCTKYKPIKKILNKQNKSKKTSKLENIILSGMKTYLARSCIPIILPTFHRIDDSIERFTQCIQEASNLIIAIKKNPIEILPFQIDLLIIPRDVIDINNIEREESPGGSGSDEFDSEDDDSEDDESSEEPSDITEQKSKPESEIENINIKSRLENNNIKYAYNGEPNPTMIREFMNLYKKYKELTDINTSNYHKLNGKPLTDLDNIGTDVQRLPHRRRLCIVVDRRLNTSETYSKKISDKNEIYLYEPHIFNEMPSKHMKEWYMESTNQCVLPGDNNNENIKANTPMDGWINIFSFHIDNEEDIKCYLYRDGQMVRFMPNDIIELFPCLFENKNYKNDKFVDSERKGKKYVTNLEKVWKDLNFKRFQEQLS